MAPSRCALFLAALVTLGIPTSGLAATVHGAVIMDGAVKVDEARFRSVKDWDRTLQFYRRVYPGKKDGYVWRSVASTAQVRAIHIANIKPGSSWEGINIYMTRGKVYIYVIPRDAPAPSGGGGKKSARRGAPNQGRGSALVGGG